MKPPADNTVIPRSGLEDFSSDDERFVDAFYIAHPQTVRLRAPFLDSQHPTYVHLAKVLTVQIGVQSVLSILTIHIKILHAHHDVSDH